MRNGYIIQTLTSVDIREIIKIGGKVIKIYGGAFYSKKFTYLRLKKLLMNYLPSHEEAKERGTM